MILIEQSLTNKTWLKYSDSYENFDTIIKNYQINPVIAKILLNRGVSFKEIPSFLDPKLKHTMEDPYVIAHMEESCNIVYKAIKENKKITILGDYDVDGLTSTTILYKYLTSLLPKQNQDNIQTYIPSRYKEGYGISEKALNNIVKSQKPNLLILLDNGSSAYNEIELARSLNIDVIIVDHHSIAINLPNANAIINPHRGDDNSGYEYLCTVGLVFLFIVAFNRTLINEKYFTNNKITQPYIMNYLDLVALGTVCDMVPLKALNRAFVFQGLKILQKRQNIALKNLADCLGINKPIDVETLGFSFGPCINAGSRMNNEQLVLDLLLSESENYSLFLAEELKNLNLKRQDEENKVIQAAITEIEESLDSKQQDILQDGINNFIFLGSQKWLSGIVGIIAGRIKENYNKPTCIYSINEENTIGVASGRSIEGINLGDIINGAKQRELLIKGGGHSQAVGFSFEISKKDELFEFISKEITKQLKNKDKNISSSILVDEVIPLSYINQGFLESLQNLEPFGMNFKEPVFMISNVKIIKVEQIGALKNHLSLIVSDDFKSSYRAFCYKCIPSLLGESILKKQNQFVDILVTPKLNLYKGKTYINLIVKDLS